MRQIVLDGALKVDGATGHAEPGPLLVEGERLRAIEHLRHEARCFALDGHLIFPGLVNAHDHLPLNCFPRRMQSAPYAHADDWVADMRQAIETPEYRAIRDIPEPARAWHGGLKNLLAGATTVLHHDPYLPIFARPDFPVTVVREIAWAHSPSLAGRYGPGLQESLAMAPAERPWFVHTGEGCDARARRDFESLEKAGVLGPRARLVHAAGLSPEQQERAIAQEVGMIWCPVSNRSLLGRIADPRRFARARLAALGSDARLSGARDLLAELKAAAATRLIDPLGLLRMVTVDAARLCGQPRAGKLSPGASADLLLLRDTGGSPAEQLIGGTRAALRAVFRAGRPMLVDPDLVAIFDRLDIAYRAILLDGRPKLIAAGLLEPLERHGIVEPGLTARQGSALPMAGA